MRDLAKISHQSYENRHLILASKICGCYYCLKIFSPNEITEWVDPAEDGIGLTAMCPKCGTDSVVGDKNIEITGELLKELRNFSFKN